LLEKRATASRYAAPTPSSRKTSDTTYVFKVVNAIRNGVGLPSLNETTLLITEGLPMSREKPDRHQLESLATNVTLLSEVTDLKGLRGIPQKLKHELNAKRFELSIVGKIKAFTAKRKIRQVKNSRDQKRYRVIVCKRMQQKLQIRFAGERVYGRGYTQGQHLDRTNFYRFLLFLKVNGFPLLEKMRPVSGSIAQLLREAKRRQDERPAMEKMRRNVELDKKKLAEMDLEEKKRDVALDASLKTVRIATKALDVATKIEGKKLEASAAALKALAADIDASSFLPSIFVATSRAFVAIRTVFNEASKATSRFFSSRSISASFFLSNSTFLLIFSIAGLSS
jgi:hypothetical protein